MAKEREYGEAINFLATKEQYDEVKAIADQQGVSMGQVMRTVTRWGLIEFHKRRRPNLRGDDL